MIAYLVNATAELQIATINVRGTSRCREMKSSAYLRYEAQLD